MSVSEEIQELHERAEHGREHAALQAVSVSMAVLAVAVAIVSVLSHRAHTDEIIDQARLRDGWAHYQSKSTRRQTTQVFTELLGLMGSQDATKAQAVRERYEQELTRLGKDSDEIQEENGRIEYDFERQERRATRFDISEAILEASIVVTSVTLLTRRRLFWFAGLSLSAVGGALALSTLGI
jgi:hypothetical protein